MGLAEALQFLGVADAAERSLERALSAFRSGLYRHGFAILDLLIQEQDARADLWKEKGRMLQSLRLNAAAVRCYRRALALEPDPFVSIALACGLQDLGEHADAIAMYDAVIRDAENAEVLAIAHANRANSRSALGETDAAVEDYQEAIRREPKRVSHRLNHALHHAKRRQWEDARRVLESGLRVVSGEESIPLLLELARGANEQEKADMGLQAADGVLALVPDHPRALYQRGWALGMLGRLDEAASCMRRILEREPGDKDAESALAKLDAALPALRPAKPWWKLWS